MPYTELRSCSKPVAIAVPCSAARAQVAGLPEGDLSWVLDRDLSWGCREMEARPRPPPVHLFFSTTQGNLKAVGGGAPSSESGFHLGVARSPGETTRSPGETTSNREETGPESLVLEAPKFGLTPGRLILAWQPWTIT